jgi:hypothetical protein
MPSNLFKFVKNRIPTLRATEFPRLSSSSTEEQCHADQFHPQRSSSRHRRVTYEAEKPAGDRPASRSSFTFNGSSPEDIFAPGTPEFLFWQCREAALAALEAFEACAGNHTRWQGNRRKLPLGQDEGVDLNAGYGRGGFEFFHQTVGETTFFSAASTDVVSHEIGHGLLDSLRPEFFGTNLLEVGAFHEAFGDCIAMLTAIEDLETRQALLAMTTDLRQRNFAESTAENLSGGIRAFRPTSNAAEARHAFNALKFQLPTSLPVIGGPGVRTIASAESSQAVSGI